MKKPFWIKSVDWDVEPTEFDKNGCDGLYLKKAPEIYWWAIAFFTIYVNFKIFLWLFFPEPKRIYRKNKTGGV